MDKALGVIFVNGFAALEQRDLLRPGEKPLQKVEFAEITRFKRCSRALSSTLPVALIPLDFGEKGVYASYKPRSAKSSWRRIFRTSEK